MRTPPSFWQGIQAVAGIVLVLAFVPACKPTVQPSGPPKAVVKTNTMVATNQASLQYVSVFLDVLPPKVRDPFFPNSIRRNPTPVEQATPEKAQPAPTLVLKGIIGNAAHRLAIFDGAILETGESGSVRVPNGKVRVKCIDIGEDYAVIQVEGEAQQKRLPLNKKSD